MPPLPPTPLQAAQLPLAIVTVNMPHWMEERLRTDLFLPTHTNTHTHTRLTAPFPGLPGWAGIRKVEPIWILLKQETVSGSGISWAYASLHLAPDR